MASLTVRNIDQSTKDGLRTRAATNGRSMEEEIRQILKRVVLNQKSARGIGSRINQRFAAIGGVEFPEASRSLPRRLPENDTEKTV